MVPNRILTLFTLMAWLVTGCIYSNSEVYTVSPVPGTPATVSASTNLDPDNPNPYNDSLRVSYDFSIDNGELFFVEGRIEQYPIYELVPDPDTTGGPYIRSDTFWLSVVVPPDSGIYALYLSFFYSPNTNSLGDILGIEADVLELEYLVDFKGGTP